MIILLQCRKQWIWHRHQTISVEISCSIKINKNFHYSFHSLNVLRAHTSAIPLDGRPQRGTPRHGWGGDRWCSRWLDNRRLASRMAERSGIVEADCHVARLHWSFFFFLLFFFSDFFSFFSSFPFFSISFPCIFFFFFYSISFPSFVVSFLFFVSFI